jgi:hypothetical protein
VTNKIKTFEVFGLIAYFDLHKIKFVCIWNLRIPGHYIRSGINISKDS